MPRRKKQIIQEAPIPQPQPAYNAAAKRWLWVWVSIFTVIIVVLWGWATRISLGSFSWSKTPEKHLIDNSKEEWNNLFDNEATRTKNQKLKTQLKNLMGQIISEANNTSSTPTTTTNISTSSTDINISNSSTLSNSTTL